MLTVTVDTLVEVARGSLVTGEPTTIVNGLATDSRRVEPGMLFVAFEGEHVDGHRFVADAVSSGARAVMIAKDPAVLAEELGSAIERNVAVIRVADSLRAVQDVASYHRGRLLCPVVGVTGSTGKTTTKDFLTSVLSLSSRVIATDGNQNNELGVPLTILRAGADTDVMVVEMAMRGLGQIAHLCEIARPTLGLVTNVGTSHIELLGTEEAIASAKGELVRCIPEGGAVFLNADDPASATLREMSVAEVVTYGTSEPSDVRACDVTVDDESRASFRLVHGDLEREIRLPLPGRHNVYNALAAISVALRLGVDYEDIERGLAAASVGDMRMQVFESASGVTVINDAYNANPSSMRAAIDALAEYATKGARIAVLGDMAELGSLTELAHFRIGEQIARLPVDTLVTVGEKAKRIADGARAEGMPDEVIRPCSTPDEASEVLDDVLQPGDVVLVKASRVMGLERVVEGIVEPRV